MKEVRIEFHVFYLQEYCWTYMKFTIGTLNQICFEYLNSIRIGLL